MCMWSTCVSVSIVSLVHEDIYAYIYDYSGAIIIIVLIIMIIIIIGNNGIRIKIISATDTRDNNIVNINSVKIILLINSSK